MSDAPSFDALFTCDARAALDAAQKLTSGQMCRYSIVASDDPDYPVGYSEQGGSKAEAAISD